MIPNKRLSVVGFSINIMLYKHLVKGTGDWSFTKTQTNVMFCFFLCIEIEQKLKTKLGQNNKMNVKRKVASKS